MKTSRAVAVLMVFLLLFAAESIAQPCKVRATNLVKGLPTDNPLAQAVNSGALGDGVANPWMKMLAEYGIRQVRVEVNFEAREPRVRYEINDVEFYGDYYEYKKKITFDSTEKKRRLLDELQLPILSQAIVTLRHISQHSVRTATIYVILLDDPCLPIVTAMPIVD